MPKLSTSKKRAFHRQNGRCYYCRAPMWLADPATFASKHGVSLKLADRLQCTAEHLVARQDGGSDSPGNIVAACKFCNRKRHARGSAMEPIGYLALVTNRLKRGRWHPPQVHCLIGK